MTIKDATDFWQAVMDTGYAMEGDNLLFAREDGVEASWRVVDDVLRDHDASIPYAPYTWGPEEQAMLFSGSDVWHDPVPGEDCPPVD